MSALTRRSIDNLSLCHPDLQVLAEKAIKYVDFEVIDGFRGKDRQDRAYAIGKSKLPWPNSKHNHRTKRLIDGELQMAPESLAFDIGAREDDKITWDAKYYYFIAGVMKTVAKILGIDIRWGGDWDSDGNFNDQTFNDLGHYELI